MLPISLSLLDGMGEESKVTLNINLAAIALLLHAENMKKKVAVYLRAVG